jgi:hypothetical protein
MTENNGTYKTRLHESITDLQQATKRGVLSRERRFEYIEAITEEYFRLTGEMPDATALERLADLCLYEELTDSDRMKVRNNEYPILSEYQFDRRDNVVSTVGDDIENSPSDGRKHLKPTRRTRSDYENKFVNKKAKIRNKERKQAYTEFTKVQPVIVNEIGDSHA